MVRGLAYRRFKSNVKKWRRLKADFNQHYNNLACDCYHNPKVQSMMADTPKRCSSPNCCGNLRRAGLGKMGLTVQERRAEATKIEARQFLGFVSEGDGFEKSSPLPIQLKIFVTGLEVFETNRVFAL